MKRVIVIIIFLAMCFSPRHVFADLTEGTTTGGYLNGKFLMLEAGEGAQVVQKAYLKGSIEYAFLMNTFRIQSAYPAGSTTEAIIKKVYDYYRTNPDKKYRIIVEVMASGCKDKELFDYSKF